MRPDEARAVGGLTGDAAAGIAGQARDLHAGVADRAFGALRALGAGPLTEPIRAAHDAIAEGAYGSSRVVLRVGGRAAGLLAGLAREDGEPSLFDGPRGAAALAALNAARGDRLARDGSALTIAMALTADPAHPPTGRVVVFVHGLGETERSWRIGGGPSYGDRLAAAADGPGRGASPVYARFNTGAGVAPSAAELSSALDELVAAWPVPVTELSLVGHSMGGLVARAAAHHGAGRAWATRLRAIVTLGTPHTGAPLARATARAARALDRLPETRPFAAPLHDRSAGIRDLEHGVGVPYLDGVEYRFVSTSLSRDERGVAGRLLGDLLVHRRSAWDQRDTERLRFGSDHYRHLGSGTHFSLLRHPAVAELLIRWLTPDSPDAARASLPIAAGADSGPAAT